jgi:hAT family dimerisation domain.
MQWKCRKWSQEIDAHRVKLQRLLDWSKNLEEEIQWPSRIAMQVLCVPASIANSIRSCSIVRLVVQECWTNLSSEIFDPILFLHSMGWKTPKGCSCWEYIKCGERKICSVNVFYVSLRIGFIHVHRRNLIYFILSGIFRVATKDLHRHDGWVAGIVFVFVLGQVEWIILRLRSSQVAQRFEFALGQVAYTTDFCIDQVRSNCWTGYNSKIFIHHPRGQACREIFHPLFFYMHFPNFVSHRSA